VLEGQGYVFMTVCDTIVSMGGTEKFVVVWWKGMGTPMISQYGKVKVVVG